MFRNTSSIIPALLLPFVFATAAHGHDGGDGGSFLTGFTHPIFGPDHVLAMVAVGIWGAQLGSPAVWILPVAFPMVMALGGFLALIGVPIPFVEAGIALSAVVLGIMIAMELKPPLAVALAVVGFFAVFHGHAHGTELPEGQSGILYSVGFVIGTGLLHAAGILLGLVHHWTWGKMALRALGVLVAIGGLYFLWGALS